MRIAVDMDEVLADTHAGKLALYRERGFDPDEEMTIGRKLDDIAPPDIARLVEAELNMGFFFADLAPIDGAGDALRKLTESHEIFVATAAMDYPASCPHKIAWLERYFPFIDRQRIVLCGEKSVVRADVLIDDSPRHFPGFVGEGVCFDAPHNRGQDVRHRLHHWADADDLIAQLECRS